jgi:hypothetical protein
VLHSTAFDFHHRPLFFDREAGFLIIMWNQSAVIVVMLGLIAIIAAVDAVVGCATYKSLKV